MVWEEEIPSIPTRQEEVNAINKAVKGFNNQSWFKLYMNVIIIFKYFLKLIN